MDRILVILGPTSTGKTDLALKLAKHFDGQLISADSRQVYKKLDIGTGKMPKEKAKITKGKGFWEIDGIKVWMYDVVSAKSQYNVAHYVKNASKIISDIQNRKRLPIIIGGTGLYIRSLLYGFSNLTVPIDLKLRQKLNKYSLSELQDKLKDKSSERWEGMNNSDRHNPRRLIRAIEITSQPVKEAKNKSLASQNNILKIGLTTTREILYQKSDQRVIARMKLGMLKEAIKLNKEGLSLERMKQLGLEYGALADYLDGKIKNKNQLIRIMQQKIHDFIKRQLTWFKKEQDVNWFDISDKKLFSKIEKLVSAWYDSGKEGKV